MDILKPITPFIYKEKFNVTSVCINSRNKAIKKIKHFECFVIL